jgi:hypothetical protein
MLTESIAVAAAERNVDDRGLDLTSFLTLCLEQIRMAVLSGIKDDSHYSKAQAAFAKIKERFTSDQIKEIWRLAREAKTEATDLYHYVYLMGRERDRRHQSQRLQNPFQRAKVKAYQEKYQAEYRASHKEEHRKYMQAWREARKVVAL